MFTLKDLFAKIFAGAVAGLVFLAGVIAGFFGYLAEVIVGFLSEKALAEDLAGVSSHRQVPLR